MSYELEPNQFVSRYPVHNTFPNYSMRTEIIGLPNLRYKNNKIYFISKTPIKIIINDIKKYIYEVPLDDIQLYGTVIIDDVKINCIILEEEDDEYLKIKITFQDRYDIFKKDIQLFAKYIEAKILNISYRYNNNVEASNMIEEKIYDEFMNHNEDNCDSECDNDYDNDNDNNYDNDYENDFNNIDYDEK